jgi:integrase
VLGKIHTAFALLRSGILDPEQSIALRASILPSKPIPPRRTAKTLQELIALYVSERSPNWKETTKISFEKDFLTMVQHLGDKDVTSYSREDFLSYRASQSASGLQANTINNRLTLLSTLLKWGVRHGYLQQNHSEGMLLKKDKAPDEQRKVYDKDDLKTIVATLPRTTRCPWKYWIPLIAMYSGMRREEICQLRGCDVLKVDEIWCFRIIADAKAGLKVKTSSSSRIVPIHPNLISAGLLDFTAMKELNSNLWGFRRYSSKGCFGSKFGNWYCRYNREYVTKDLLKCFHSFRHTLTDYLKQTGVQEGLIAEIVGHSNDSVTTGRYGKRFKAGVLLEVIQKVDYGLTSSVAWVKSEVEDCA